MHLQHIDIRIIPILSHTHSASISLLPTIKYTYAILLASHTLAAGSQRLPADVVLEPVPGYLPLAVWIAGVDFKAVLGIPPRVGVHFVEVKICGDEGGGGGRMRVVVRRGKCIVEVGMDKEGCKLGMVMWLVGG